VRGRSEVPKPRRRQAGEGSIQQYATKAGPRYLIKYRVPQEDGTTREALRRKTRDGRSMTTRRQAADELRDILSKISEGAHVTPQKMTASQWLDQWLDGLRVAPSTEASYRKNVRVHIAPALGNIQLSRLTGTRISALYRDLERNGRRDHERGSGLSARTVKYCHTILKSALRAAVAEGVLASNPADRAQPPSAKEAKAPEIRPWTAGQLSAFLAWSEEHDCTDAVAWRVLAFTGMRRGELLALRWRDPDADAARLSVRRSMGVVKTKGQGEQLIEGPTKTGRQRSVDLDPRTIDALRRYRVAHASLDLRLVRDESLIFSDLNGGYLNPDRFSRRFTRSLALARRQVGAEAVPVIRVHDLRHTHASVLLGAGVPVKVVSERLGHATVTITLETYQHVMPGMQAEAAAKFAALVGGAQ
jgi:integrase